MILQVYGAREARDFEIWVKGLRSGTFIRAGIFVYVQGVCGKSLHPHFLNLNIMYVGSAARDNGIAKLKLIAPLRGIAADGALAIFSLRPRHDIPCEILNCPNRRERWAIG